MCPPGSFFKFVYFGLSVWDCSFYLPDVWLSLFVHVCERLPALVPRGRWRGVPLSFFSSASPAGPSCLNGRASCGSGKGDGTDWQRDFPRGCEVREPWAGNQSPELELGRLMLLGVEHFNSLVRKPTFSSPRIVPFYAFEGVNSYLQLLCSVSSPRTF